MTNKNNLWADITTAFPLRFSTSEIALKIRTLTNRALSRPSPASSPSLRPSRRTSQRRTSANKTSNRPSCRVKSKQCLLRLMQIKQIKMKRNHFLTNRKKRLNLPIMAKGSRKSQRIPPLRRGHPAKSSKTPPVIAKEVRNRTALNLTTK